jgi:pyruvate dehydrogenase E2 component (dihydrolipoamide acetyltransferase)
METGKLIRWLVNVGDEVEAGTPLFEIETSEYVAGETVTMRIAAMQEGYVARIFAETGAELPANFPMGVLCEDDFEIEEFDSYPTPKLKLGCPGSAQGLRFNFDAKQVLE